MVERAARAIYSRSYLGVVAQWARGEEKPLVTEILWEDCSEPHRLWCFSQARAAIQAMREPTNAMVETAVPLWSEYESFPSETPKAMWQAMIDEALK